MVGGCEYKKISTQFNVKLFLASNRPIFLAVLKFANIQRVKADLVCFEKKTGKDNETAFEIDCYIDVHNLSR